jgi:membrane-associated phospholipid phosphatase
MYKRVKEYWGIYLLMIYFLSGIAGFLYFEKGDTELWLNQQNTPAADIFFKYCTYIGGGITFAILLLALLFYRYYYAILTSLVIIFQTIFVQGIKLFIFPAWDRPVIFFQEKEIHLVDGVRISIFNSFPSGHTATAFSIATILTLIIRNRKLSLVWYFIAILVALSRVYLMQHFFMDIYAGAIIGITVSLVTFHFLERSSLKSSTALNKSIRTVF